MLRVHVSNRFEILRDTLVAQLGQPSGSPFDAEHVIVPSAAVRRRLTLDIADAHSVCAQVQFGFLAQWMWTQIGRVVPAVAQQSPLAPPLLAWRIHAALGDAAFVAPFPRLAAYLTGADDVMRFELAQRVAGLMDQYVTYRPQWLDRWQAGKPADLGEAGAALLEDERWQAAVWRRITTELSLDSPHPIEAFRRALQSGGEALARSCGLPGRAHIFALPTMPPLHIDLLRVIGTWVDLDVYLLNPCRHYWFEIVPPARLAWLRTQGRAQAQETGNRLLAAWGRQTQALVDLLVDRWEETTLDDGGFVPSGGSTLLAHLQDSVLDLTEIEPATVALAENDRSLEVHVCHSLTRELECLHDRLLSLFATDPGLKPSDILVVTPDLEAAAPLVDAVFGTMPPARRIAFTVTGLGRSRVNAPARVLLALLSLASSRVPAGELFGVLQQPTVARRLRMDDAALDQTHEWILQSGMRWGLDAAHRQGFDVPPSDAHTLADALDRLFLGYALPSRVADTFGEQLPAGHAQGSQALVLGGLWRFASALRQLHAQTATARSAAGWRTLLAGALETFVDVRGDEIEDLRELHVTLGELEAQMSHGGADTLHSLAVVRAALEQALDDPARGGMPSGGVTFAAMSSLRSLPFRVICMVGLNDGAFPSAAHPAEFDLMAPAPQRGDRQRRLDERNLFLDLLLAARERVVLSYSGKSVRDNTPVPASVLVAELLDVLVPAIAEDASSATSLGKARQRLVVEHPLQAFSPDVFRPGTDDRIRGFDADMARALSESIETARARVTVALAPGHAPQGVDPHAAPDGTDPQTAARGAGLRNDDLEDSGDDVAVAEPAPRFFVGALPDPGPEWRVVSAERLAEFLRNPCRYLLSRRLGIELWRDAAELQDDEPFVPDHAGRKALAARLMPALLAGADADTAARLAHAGTEMPPGTLGRCHTQRELGALTQFAARVREATREAVLPPHPVCLAFDLEGEPWRLQAAYADLRPRGLVRWRHGELRANDMLDAWVHHLVLAAAPAAGVQTRSWWVATNTTMALRPPQDPRALLTQLLALYRRGLREPLHFFPRTSLSFVQYGESMFKALKTWTPSQHTPYAEGADAAYRLALRGVDSPLDDEFVTLSKTVIEPLLAHREDLP